MTATPLRSPDPMSESQRNLSPRTITPSRGDPNSATRSSRLSNRVVENNPSPTSTLSDSAHNNTYKLKPGIGLHPGNITANPRRVLLRSDPAMLTCFDPSDKELYDLWAPKR